MSQFRYLLQSVDSITSAVHQQLICRKACSKMLPLRKCGSQGFECLAQGLGCMSMSAFYGVYHTEEAQAEARSALDKAIEMEGMMLDTADAYGPYTNEQLIGETTSSFQLCDDRSECC